ncbi:hypothetical protein C8J57DRAFT_1289761 [Mycena rebaudengoi]|nr:hypothetical protein C8J57DRAFT_1289761 [Mycena rebaudengoi]
MPGPVRSSKTAIYAVIFFSFPALSNVPGSVAQHRMLVATVKSGSSCILHIVGSLSRRQRLRPCVDLCRCHSLPLPAGADEPRLCLLAQGHNDWPWLLGNLAVSPSPR